MSILVTGAAGFIGYHVSQVLLGRGERVVGVDSLNDYYDVALKQARLDQLAASPGFQFVRTDISAPDAFNGALAAHQDIDRVVHLAAQAGVRYSLDHPFAYIDANVTGHLTILEFCRHLPSCLQLVYASSSSVYGGNTKQPFSIDDRVDSPVSLYAATKRANEHMSHSYSHLYRIPQTGLRFFTVYGPWGRPDMALYIFTKAMVEGRPITIFNKGDMKRDFTYIDDIVAGVVAALDNPPEEGSGAANTPHRLYNIGNNRTEPLMRLVEVLEEALGLKAEIEFAPMQPGDVKETSADISAISRELGFAPSTSIDIGIPRFVDWYRSYHNLS